MRVTIHYDDGKEEEIELQKQEVIRTEDGNVAHFKYVKISKEASVLVHIYLPTSESPTTKPVDVSREVEEKKISISRYNNVADDLISRARMFRPPSETCVYCGDIASNTFNGKKVCSSCFSQLSKHGERSEEFNKYLRNKTIHRWNS
ncbi:hypothetical protein [Sulfuracidifex metallicus]|jgi:hypothetical protein|uniref:Uncharacterized protein n=1 Tax=Sulfuracidifex metallicus DSM 6482 = JCM 9184 TaxID=523847 RepID=A0A6A9QL34_SULME|nr:hypothetical protein [Sulfuracidifex metallicus]MUN28990.1 hypothetical protein [Sulfuracidifex metallicus DSM 6482 = JCM 9184]WOE50500.1 hypothetical protein RQ359_002033 [Sulfuracidifex metallicus DSM 6482 = JCM 9184]